MENDVSEIYEARLKAARPWAIYLVGWLILLIVAPISIILFDDDLARKYWPLLIVLLGAALAPCIGPIRSLLKCPSCGRFMGRDIGVFCPLCGARLRKNTTRH